MHKNTLYVRLNKKWASLRNASGECKHLTGSPHFARDLGASAAAHRVFIIFNSLHSVIATASISNNAPFGNCRAAKQARAGRCSPKYFVYTSFASLKLSIVDNMPNFPNIFLIFTQHLPNISERFPQDFHKILNFTTGSVLLLKFCHFVFSQKVAAAS